METWDAIRARRNVRMYTDQRIRDEDLDRILEAGWRAPSASNRQRWEFVLITDKAQLEALGGVWQGARHIPGAQAAIVLLLPEPTEERFITTRPLRPRPGDIRDVACCNRPRHRQRTLLDR